MRPTKTKYYLDIASVVATRSTCLRRQYGAVIVKNDRIISTGFNGTAKKQIHCSDSGSCWRETHNIPHGQQYEKCRAVHAEANAIINADPEAMMGATLYLYGWENGKRVEGVQPCEMCAKLIANTGIRKVITTDTVDDEI